MPTENTYWERNFFDRFARQYQAEVYSKTSTTSPRINGKLALRPQAFSFAHDRVMSHWETSDIFGNRSPVVGSALDGGSLPPGWTWSALDTQAYAKFQGKIRKGSASLGVTAASWKQSRDMIVNRTNHFRRTLDSSIGHLEKNPGALKRLRKEREPLAGQILEYEFGWVPLVQDLKAALTTVCKDGLPDEWVTSRARGPVAQSQGSLGSGVLVTWDGQCSTTYNARVQISNPNLWLLNRMGLINPGVVAWDLIPWSFVVNMFLNVNTMIGAITDEVGLTFSGQNITHTSVLGREVMRSNTGAVGPLWTFSRTFKKSKSRTLGASLAPSWQVKVPDLNWELAVIAVSLVVQKIKKLNRLIRLI